MSLRDSSYQSEIELGLADTEYIGALKREREVLTAEVERINQRLARIEELLLPMKDKSVPNAKRLGREYIAKLAEAEGEVIFAGEVRAGCWDHRVDVATAIARAAATKGENQ